MIFTYQYKLDPSAEQAETMLLWGELLRRHWNYALGQRMDWLNRTRSLLDRCSLVCEPMGEIPEKVDYLPYYKTYLLIYWSKRWVNEGSVY